MEFFDFRDELDRFDSFRRCSTMDSSSDHRSVQFARSDHSSPRLLSLVVRSSISSSFLSNDRC